MKHLVEIVFSLALALLLFGCELGTIADSANEKIFDDAEAIETKPDINAEEDDKKKEYTLVLTEYQLFPPEDQDFGEEFNKVYDEFKSAIFNRDADFIDNFIDDSIFFSFGYSEGKDNFYEYWESIEEYYGDNFWSELEKIIILGGTYDKEAKTFIAPYIWSETCYVPDRLLNNYYGNEETDSYVRFYTEKHDEIEDEDYPEFIIDKNVKVYEKEDVLSNVIDYLSYNICRTIYGDRDADFVKVRTLSGTEGYIETKYSRSIIDYRILIELTKTDNWRLTTMIAGD